MARRAGHHASVRSYGTSVAVTWQELHDQVAALAAGLRSLGVERGDRVVAYVPNTPEALRGIPRYATSLGATWSSCSPDFGAESVVDRFAQIEPKDPYRRGRLPLRRQRLRPDGDRRRVCSKRCRASGKTVLFPYPERRPLIRARLDDTVLWEELLSENEDTELRVRASPL